MTGVQTCALPILIRTLYVVNELVYQYIIIRLQFFWLVTGQVQRFLYKINYKTGYLGRQYVEVIRKKYKQHTNAKANTVFPEIFIESL